MDAYVEAGGHNMQGQPATERMFCRRGLHQNNVQDSGLSAAVPELMFLLKGCASPFFLHVVRLLAVMEATRV